MVNLKLENLLRDPRINWKFIFIVVIVGFLTGAGILGYYYLWIKDLETKLAEIETKLPAVKPPEKVIEDETANWKIYTSSKIGFSIKYPPGWETSEEQVRGESIGMYIDKQIYQGLYSGVNIVKGPLNLGDTERKFDPVEVINSYEKEVIDKEFPGAKKEERKEIIIDGVNATKFCGMTQGKEQYCDIVVLREDEAFIIRCFSEEQECRVTFDLMLSTFRFLE